VYDLNPVLAEQKATNIFDRLENKYTKAE